MLFENQEKQTDVVQKLLSARFVAEIVTQQRFALELLEVSCRSTVVRDGKV